MHCMNVKPDVLCTADVECSQRSSGHRRLMCGHSVGQVLVDYQPVTELMGRDNRDRKRQSGPLQEKNTVGVDGSDGDELS